MADTICPSTWLDCAQAVARASKDRYTRSVPVKSLLELLGSRVITPTHCLEPTRPEVLFTQLCPPSVVFSIFVDCDSAYMIRGSVGSMTRYPPSAPWMFFQVSPLVVTFVP